MATIGTESMYASAIGVTRLVAPGPEVAMQTPTFPVADAYPSAAWPAPCSWRTRMWRTFSEASIGAEARGGAPPRFGVEHRVVGREDGAARDAEDGVAADGLEREDERLRPGDLAGRRDGDGRLYRPFP